MNASIFGPSCQIVLKRCVEMFSNKIDDGRRSDRLDQSLIFIIVKAVPVLHFHVRREGGRFKAIYRLGLTS